MAATLADENKIVKDALSLIDQGWSQISSLSALKRDVIFVLGGTGAGKSTVTQIITGSLSDLTSKQGQIGSGYVIVDSSDSHRDGRIGDPRVESKTFLPEYLVCPEEPSLVFIDCPGFNDNRGTHMDIAAMVLIKKIAENVDTARFLFVTPSSSVSYSNLNRNDFSLLCTHATSFITNLSKVKDSMSLIVTKVNNCDPSSGQPTQDPMVVNETSTFLNEVASQASTTLENRQFIEQLLQAKSHWALVRFPSKPGPLDELEHFVNVRKSIQEMCKKLRRARVSSADFAITLAPESKYVISKRLVPFMRGEIDKIVKTVVTSLEVKYLSEFQGRFNQSQKTKVLVDLMHNLGAICENLKDVVGVRNSTSGEVSNILKTIAKWLEVELDRDGEMTELGKLEEQLQVFQRVTQEIDEQPSVVLAQSVNSLRTRLDDLYKGTMKMVKEVVLPNLESQTKDEGVKILATIDKQYTQGFRDALQTGTRGGYARDILRKLEMDRAKFEKMDDQSSDTLSVVFAEVCMGLNLPLPDFNDLKRLENDLSTLLELTDLKGRVVQMSVVPEIRKSIRTLRTEAKDKIRDKFIKNINEKIQQKLDQSIQRLEDKFFREVFYPNLSLATLGEKLNLITAVMDQLEGSGRNDRGIVLATRAMHTAFGVEMQESDETELNELVGILDFYDQFLGSPCLRPMDEWMRGARVIQERLRDMKILYEHLEHSKSTDPNTIDDDILSEGSGDIISRTLKLLRATPEVCRFVEKRAKEQDKLLIKQLANYIESGKTDLEMGVGQSLVVKGRQVKFSHFLNDSGTLNCNKNDITKVLVLASEKVTIDKDFNGTGKQMVLKVIANRWDVNGFHSIHLEGAEGPPHSDKKAANGKDYGEGGKEGLPGNCGSNGGHFIGVYNVLKNSQNLAVYADGGNGGPGQAGGNGYEGKAGRDAAASDFKCPSFNDFGNTLARLDVRLVSTVLPNKTGEGDKGGRGGCGGDGGAGGKPGEPGTIQLLSMSKPVPIGTTSCRPGNPGHPGDGGEGARGGKNGNGLEVTSLTRYLFSGDRVIVDNGRGATGDPGKAGENKSGQLDPPAQSSAKLDWRDVEQFRSYIMEECLGQTTSGSQLVDLIDKHPGISESHRQFGLMSLCTHLCNLELCFYRHSSETGGVVTSSVGNEYQKYQSRLLGYASNLSPSDLNSQHHLLNILYAACLSKMILLREQKESSTTVVNVRLYLKSLASRIAELESLSIQQWRLDHFNDFQVEMDGKICQLETAINVTTTQYLGQLETTLVSSLNRAIHREHLQLHAEIESRRGTKSNSTGGLFVLSKIFEGLCTVASFVSLFGKVATSIYGFLKSAPAVVKGVAAAVYSGEFLKNLKTFCIQSIMQSEFVRDLSNSIADSVNCMKDIVKQANAMLGGQEILATFESVLGEIVKSIHNLENLGKEDKIDIIERIGAMAEMEKHVGDLIRTIVHKKDELLKSGKETAKAVVGNFDKILRQLLMTTSKTRLICDQGNTQKLPDEVIQAIVNLERKKQHVYTLILPVLKTIMTDLGSLSSCRQSENNSIARTLAKWKLAVTMDQLRTSLNLFVEGTDALSNPDICQCLSQIKGGISMTVELYEEIAKFEDTKKLACFIEKVASFPTPEATIKDVALQEAFLKARFLVKTNIFLVDWVIAVKTFKQWAFPFAEKWFPVQDDLAVAHKDITNVLTGNNGDIEESLATVAKKYAENYCKLVTIFQDYRATAPDIDRVLFIKDFNETQPFYRWTSVDHRGAIKAFLLGKRVTFTADVWKSPWQQNETRNKLEALKFKNIHLCLRVSNPEKKQRLNDILKTFRVTMTHSGVSHYIVNGQEFILKSRSRPEFSYTFDKSAKNLVSVKSESDGDYLHSPYTEWTLRLSPMEAENCEGGNRMEEFIDEDIELTLCGNGSCIDEREVKESGLDCQLFKNLSSHYRSDD